MANSIARQPLRLGALLLLLLAVIAGLLIWQISHSDTAEKAADESQIVEQAGTIDTELAVTPPAGSAPGTTVDPAIGADADFAGIAADAESAFYIDFTGSSVTSGGTVEPPPPADPPARTGVLSGTVVDATKPDGGALPRISVYLARSDGVFTGATALTGDDGSFTFAGLAPGDYKLYFFDLTGTWRAAWYDGISVPTGSLVSVGSGQEVRIVQGMKQADLEDGAISGKVTDASGKGVAGVGVMAFHVDEAEGALLLLKGTAVTDAEGDYVITGLPTDKSIVPGDGASPVAGYKVQFVSPGDLYSSQWYFGQPTHLTAKLLQLKPAEKLGGINAVMTGGSAKTANIAAESGQMILSAGGQPSTVTDENGSDENSEDFPAGEADGAEPVDEDGGTVPGGESGGTDSDSVPGRTDPDSVPGETVPNGESGGYQPIDGTYSRVLISSAATH